jgi:hypothetical protein
VSASIRTLALRFTGKENTPEGTAASEAPSPESKRRGLFRRHR